MLSVSIRTVTVKTGALKSAWGSLGRLLRGENASAVLIARVDWAGWLGKEESIVTESK